VTRKTVPQKHTAAQTIVAVRVKWRGKSPPASGWPGGRGKPHLEQDRTGGWAGLAGSGAARSAPGLVAWGGGQPPS